MFRDTLDEKVKRMADLQASISDMQAEKTRLSKAIYKLHSEIYNTKRSDLPLDLEEMQVEYGQLVAEEITVSNELLKMGEDFLEAKEAALAGSLQREEKVLDELHSEREDLQKGNYTLWREIQTAGDSQDTSARRLQLQQIRQNLANTQVKIDVSTRRLRQLQAGSLPQGAAA